jgi:hypothetical protein
MSAAQVESVVAVPVPVPSPEAAAAKPKRAPRKRKAATAPAEQPTATRTKASADPADPKPARPNPRPASSNPKAHEAACKKKQDHINSSFLNLINTSDPKVTKRLERKTVVVNGKRELALGQSICEHELRLVTQKYGVAPTTSTKRKSGYMNFTKIMRAAWSKKPEYSNIDKKNPNGSKAIVSDIAKQWKSLSSEEHERYTNMTDEELETRISTAASPSELAL